MGFQRKLGSVKLLVTLIVLITGTLLLIYDVGGATYRDWIDLVVIVFVVFGVLHEGAKTKINTARREFRNE